MMLMLKQYDIRDMQLVTKLESLKMRSTLSLFRVGIHLPCLVVHSGLHIKEKIRVHRLGVSAVSSACLSSQCRMGQKSRPVGIS